MWRGLLFIAALVTSSGCRDRAGAAVHRESGESGTSKPGMIVNEHGGVDKTCEEHGVPEFECGICHPERAAILKPGEGSKVRLPAADSARLVGVEVAAVTLGTLDGSVDSYVELAFNQNKLAQIAAPVGGIIQEVNVELGSKVEEKQCVAKLWSAAIAEAMAKAVLTHQTLERERKLRVDRVTSEKDLQQAEAEHRAACQQARTLGFSEQDVDRMAGKANEPVFLEVRAPFGGEIIDRTAVQGALVEAGKPLFSLVDRTVMWAVLSLREMDLARVRKAQKVEVRIDSLPGRVFTGELTWVAAEVDEKSRTVRARAEIANPDGVLKARMFGRARILTGRAEGVVIVPTTAICMVEGKPFVFVRLADDLFEARAVRTGVQHDYRLEVVQGLKAEENVVVNHGFALKSHWLSSRMGAGCTD